MDKVKQLLPADNPKYRELYHELQREYPEYKLVLIPHEVPADMPETGETAYVVSHRLRVETFVFDRANRDHIEAFYGIGVSRNKIKIEAALDAIKKALGT